MSADKTDASRAEFEAWREVRRLQLLQSVDALAERWVSEGCADSPTMRSQAMRYVMAGVDETGWDAWQASRKAALEDAAKIIEMNTIDAMKSAPTANNDSPRLIGCVQHDCAECKKRYEAQTEGLVIDEQSVFWAWIALARPSGEAVQSEWEASGDYADFIDSTTRPAPPPSGEREAIHYPECWDTAAYPTLESALSEMYAWFKCDNEVHGEVEEQTHTRHPVKKISAREALIKRLRERAAHLLEIGINDSPILFTEAADMLAADAQGPAAKLQRHNEYRAGFDEATKRAQQVAVPMTEAEIDTVYGQLPKSIDVVVALVRAIEVHHGIGVKP